MATRRHNPRRAKSHLSYTINEAAELYGVHRQTVRSWLVSGLEPNDAGRPVLIHGTELNRFQHQRRASAKARCGPGEMYCFGCQTPRRPAGSLADYIPAGTASGKVTGICPECDRMMSQHVNAARLAVFQAELEIVTRPHHEPIIGS